MEGEQPQHKSSEHQPELVVKQEELNEEQVLQPEAIQGGLGNKQSTLTESEKRRVAATLEQLESVRAALGNMDSELGSSAYGPDEAEDLLKSEWLPQSLHVVSKYLDVDRFLTLLESASEHVMRPILKPTNDMMELLKQAPAKTDWVERYRKKLSRIDQLIRAWEEEIIADPAAFIERQKAFSLKNKTELNFPMRAFLCCLAIFSILFLVMLPPIVKFASGFTNPHILLGAVVLLWGFGLAALFLRSKELWIGLFFTVAIGLLPFFCLPKPEPLKPVQMKPAPTKSEPIKSELQKPQRPKHRQ